MSETVLLHELPLASAQRRSEAIALVYSGAALSYGDLALTVQAFAAALLELGVNRGDRLAIFIEKRFEAVAAAFGAAAAGAIFVPVNPLLRPEQVAYILRDCNARALVTSAARLGALRGALAACLDLRHVVTTDAAAQGTPTAHYAIHGWLDTVTQPAQRAQRVSEDDIVAILYTSGSTGRPKGVVLSHRNMVRGAKSVASYLQNVPEDVLLAALPLSFDAGFSQLTTAFHAGARVVLLNYLLPRDLLNTLARERVTGLTGVPPLYIQLAGLEWPEAIAQHLRYFANTGGRMPAATLRRLRALLPRSKPYLMYGLTEAFRATYLPPEEVDRRPDSIGKAIPDAEVLVLREDGSRCQPDEPGELVQRGSLVALGYWNDPERTAERFKPLPPAIAGPDAATGKPEIAVFSGDTVRADAEGFLYFIGRRDDMIKTSGYRVSPTEVEEVLYDTQLIGEAAAFGVPHPELGQAIVIVATPRAGEKIDGRALAVACREHLPLYMQPVRIEVRERPLPRNANQKIDRKLLAEEFEHLFDSGRG